VPKGLKGELTLRLNYDVKPFAVKVNKPDLVLP
jgi:hypothetical protein